ncbi:MAG: hypothetical protein OXC98_10030 [bacterium]|nr:hypothetical protein [Acidimicrobiia bacterium]MCY4650686.1 hypothetical protein [bacterium]
MVVVVVVDVVVVVKGPVVEVAASDVMTSEGGPVVEGVSVTVEVVVDWGDTSDSTTVSGDTVVTVGAD